MKKEIKKKLRNAQRLQNFAVVTNRPGGGLAMVQWNRKKASSIQHTGHIVENQLMGADGGARPSLAIG